MLKGINCCVTRHLVEYTYGDKFYLIYYLNIFILIIYLIKINFNKILNI